MAVELRNQEIFAVGTWNGMTFDERDLDDIVTAFNELREVHNAPLKFGHNKKQPITDGQPALGWVTRVFRQGQKLMADFSDVPSVVAKAIKRKLYRKVSVELLFDAKYQGKRLPLVLDAVALLGADHPAVSTLADLEVLAMQRAPFDVNGVAKSFSAIAGNQKPREEELTMEADVKAAFDELRSQVTAIADSVKTFTKKADDEESPEVKQLKDQLAAITKERADFARTGINEIFDAAVTAKKITPAQRELFSKQLGVDNDERVIALKGEDVRALLGVTADADDKGGKKGKGGDGQAFSRSQDDADDGAFDKGKADQEVFKRARELQSKSQGLTFSRAMEQVLQADPELATAYRDVSRTRANATS